MNYKNLIKIALKALANNKFRGFLTMLGIIIGVASVIAMLAIGQGSKRSIREQISEMGSNMIMVHPGNGRFGGVRQSASSMQTLKLEDYRTIEREASYISACSPTVSSSGQAIYGANNAPTTVYGISPDYLEIRRYKVEDGDMFTEQDIQTAAKVCVVGKTVVDNLFPDGSKPDWESLSWLQKRFMKWFNRERTRTVLTFPVETMALLTENGDVKDKEWGDFTAEMYAEGHSFFTYMSDNADSLSSCCRLRNEITDNGFSYTLGAGGVSTGSKSVLTINLNRCIQYAARKGMPYQFFLEEVVDLVHKVQLAYNENLKYMQSKGMLPLFDAGYINMSRQYLTIGVNGLVEAAEFLGIPINDNPDYERFTQEILGMIEKYNKKYRSKEVMFNCEMIPAENVGVKHAKWDKRDGYKVGRDCYNSYFYIVEDESLNIVDKFRLHGRKYIEHLTGGSALHMNLQEHLSREQYRHLLRVASQEGCNYFTFNIPNTVCNDCGHIDKRNLKACPKCNGRNLDYLTRIIGYMKRVSNFSQARQQEAARRHYATPGQL